MPHAYEVLEYLAGKYNLYILSNGFQELQCHKMRSAGIDHFFKKIVLSDDIGILKPWPEIFHFALSATQSEVRDSLMIGARYYRLPFTVRHSMRHGQKHRHGAKRVCQRKEGGKTK